jgi:hypothetical protein
MSLRRLSLSRVRSLQWAPLGPVVETQAVTPLVVVQADLAALALLAVLGMAQGKTQAVTLARTPGVAQMGILATLTGIRDPLAWLISRWLPIT